MKARKPSVTIIVGHVMSPAADDECASFGRVLDVEHIPNLPRSVAVNRQEQEGGKRNE